MAWRSGRGDSGRTRRKFDFHTCQGLQDEQARGPRRQRGEQGPRGHGNLMVGALLFSNKQFRPTYEDEPSLPAFF